MNRDILITLNFIAGFQPAVGCQDPYAVTYHANPVKMRDGVTLLADIFRPRPMENFPCPYSALRMTKNNEVSIGLEGAARGYVVIVQDVRGRYASEGEWYTFKHESEDAMTPSNAAAACHYSDERVGMFGGRNVGANPDARRHAHPHILRNLSGGDSQQLSRKLDLSGGPRTMVMNRGFGLASGHAEPCITDNQCLEKACGSSDQLSAFPIFPAATGAPINRRFSAIFSRLACPHAYVTGSPTWYHVIPCRAV